MAHEHHHGESSSEYYVEQLFTILVVGALGIVAIQMYRTEMLRFVLAEQFHIPVLIGGIAILLLVALRAVAIWRESGKQAVHDHHHDHSHDDHGHSHDLSWAFARLLILVFPVALFLLGVPNAGFSQEHIEKLLGKEKSIEGQVKFDEDKRASGSVTEMRFNDLNNAAYDPGKRESLAGQFVTMRGQLERMGDKEFRLFTQKMTCCAADTVLLKVRMITKQSLSGFNNGEWVQVQGQIQFVHEPDSNRYIPVLKVPDLTDIKPIKAGRLYE